MRRDGVCAENDIHIFLGLIQNLVRPTKSSHRHRLPSAFTGRGTDGDPLPETHPSLQEPSG
jgi:hypothetical protein